MQSPHPADDDLVMSLVDDVLAQPSEMREDYARLKCAGNGELFTKIWHYVYWENRMKGFLLHPVYRLPADEPTLEAGQVLESRFRIVRKVAAGGMGVVYEAWDEKLDRRIAIKCAKAGFHARLSPEVRHSSEVNHPNVCKTWDIHTATKPEGEFDFLTMEFIEGQTLAERLREGPVPADEAQAIATQLCAGLAEAHRKQVIHGDLKCGNVLLARALDGIRVAITDFGLARSWLVQDHASAPAAVGGTLDYMAPELLQHGTPSVASDIYALGVILHEVASGRTPSPVSVAAGTRMAPRPPPLAHRWGKAIARCLEQNPAQRWPSVPALAESLAPFRWGRWTAMAAGLVLAGAIASLAYRQAHGSGEPIRLAVVPFEAAASDQSLSEGILLDTVQRLRQVKGSRGTFTVMPVHESLHGEPDPAKAAALLGATHVLTGTLQGGSRVRIHAVVADARTRLQLQVWDAEYLPGELSMLPVAIAGIVTGTLRLPPLAQTATVNTAAFADFTQGVALFERDSVDAALPLLVRAVAADPASPLTYARLAEAQARKYGLSLNSDWLTAAESSLQQARQRNPDLPLLWLVSAKIDEYQGVYETAESDLKRGLELDPRDGDLWRQLGRIYKLNNHFASATTAFEKAIEVQPSYFLNYLNLCALETQQARYTQAVQECRKMVQLVPEQSDAHFALGLPLFCKGKYAEADAEFRRAIELDPRSMNAIFSRAFALTSQGRPAEALPLFLKAIEIGPASHLLYCDLGTTYRLLGSLSSARKAYATGLLLAEKKLEQNPRDSITKVQLAYLCAQLGEKNRARSELLGALHLASDSVEVAWWAMLTWEALGDREQAFAILARMPEESLSRLNRETDLADFRHTSRFHEMLVSRKIQLNKE